MIEELLPTILSQRIAKATVLLIPGFWFFFDLILPLMPLKLEANQILTKLLLSLALLCISLIGMLVTVVKSHNQLSVQLKSAQEEAAENFKKAEFNYFINHPIIG
jgi:uncharacterized membrane protein